MVTFTESVVEEATLAWLAALGYAGKHGPEIAAGEPAAMRSDAVWHDPVPTGTLHAAGFETLDQPTRELAFSRPPSLRSAAAGLSSRCGETSTDMQKRPLFATCPQPPTVIAR